MSNAMPGVPSVDATRQTPAVLNYSTGEVTMAGNASMACLKQIITCKRPSPAHRLVLKVGTAQPGRIQIY